MKFLLVLFCLALTVPLSAKTAKVKKPLVKSLKHSLKPGKATLTVKKPALKRLPIGYEEAKFVLPPAVWLTTAYSRGMFRNITAPPFKPRGPVYLPKGSTNVALNKPVTSSDERPKKGTIRMVTDGDKKWAQGSQLELAPGTQWVQIDLQKPHLIHGILLWHYAGLGAVYRDVVIQLADDPDFVINLRTVYNNDNNNSSGLGVGRDREFYEDWRGQWIPIKAQKARYVRLYSNGSTRDPINLYTEAEVWGQPTK
jgi:hypothetical protein